MINNTRSLFELDSIKKNRDLDLAIKYSSFKHGKKESIDFFANLLTKKIESEYDIYQKSDWLIVTVPYLKLPHPIQPVCENISEKLGIPFLESTNPNPFNSGQNYQLISSKRKRLNIIKTIDLQFKNSSLLAGKRIILIDDATTSGAMIEHLTHILCNNYKAKEVVPYTFLKFTTEDPSFEDTVSSLLVSDQYRDRLIKILNLTDTVINRLVVKNIFLSSDEIFSDIINKLSPISTKKLVSAAKVLFDNGEQNKRIEELIKIKNN